LLSSSFLRCLSLSISLSLSLWLFSVLYYAQSPSSTYIFFFISRTIFMLIRLRVEFFFFWKLFRDHFGPPPFPTDQIDILLYLHEGVWPTHNEGIAVNLSLWPSRLVRRGHAYITSHSTVFQKNSFNPQTNKKLLPLSNSASFMLLPFSLTFLQEKKHTLDSHAKIKMSLSLSFSQCFNFLCRLSLVFFIV